MFRFLSVLLVSFAILLAPAQAQSPKAGFAKDKSAFKGGKAGKGARAGAWTEDPRARKPPIRWIDVHMHMLAPRAAGFEKTTQMALAEMNRYGLAGAVIMPQPLSPGDFTEFARSLQRHPDRFAFLGGSDRLNTIIHTTEREAVTAELKEQFVAYAESVLNAGGGGWGEMATLHFSLADGHKYMRAEPDHPLFLALAEVAGRYDAVIDLHHDPIAGAKPLAAGLKSPPNPAQVPDNMAAFERLLAHDRRAKIVWAHGGMDPFGGMTPQLVGRLMDKHPNLYMSLRVPPPPIDVVPHLGIKIRNKILHPHGVDRDWLAVLLRHPDRFVLGTDSFFIVEGSTAPTTAFVAGNEVKLLATNLFLASIPGDLARRIAVENPVRIYKLELKK